MFEAIEYIIESIDGDYAHLRRVDKPEEDLKLVARALLPDMIREGSRLEYEMLQYTLLDWFIHIYSSSLTNFLIQKQATFENERVFIPISSLNARKQRGGSGKISGYKINSLFFIYKEDCKVIGETVSFDISKVQQLNPTIAGKMFFKALDYEEVSKYYKNLF